MYKNFIKKLVLGTTETQEYICTGFQNLSDPFKVFLSFKNNPESKEVTASHIFLGYKPLLIGITLTHDDTCYSILQRSTEVCLSFQRNLFTDLIQKNAFYIDTKSDALIFLKILTEKKFNNQSLFIFEGVFGEHHFLSPFHQFTNSIHEKLKRKRRDNINLPGNLYKQVAIAYSVPRIISVISLGKNNLFNLFPTDLHGAIDDTFYVGSLRHEGKACQQVEEIKKIALANVPADFSQDAYAMGKNHMQGLKSIDNFKTGSLRTELFNYPLPDETLSYREMELQDHFDAGIHRLLFYKIIHQKVISNNSATLCHLHKHYITWRNKKGLNTERLIR
ncbi:MAG: hypothetical protein H7Y00_08350 [Fimbriimonadaceae bacterium]|nr:hypothetical protein [Chitinophagales bacterium]